MSVTRGCWVAYNGQAVCLPCAVDDGVDRPMAGAERNQRCERCGGPMPEWKAGALPPSCGCWPDHRPDCPTHGSPSVARRS